ncbi:MAG TPA: CPBP family intramembrane glutamic endopeptidase [Anaerolineales bacterium]
MQNKHESSIFTFFVLVFILSIPFWVLGIIYPIQLLPGLPISALGAFTPALGAIILTYKYEHLSGVLQLLQRSFDFKRIKNKNWFLVILLANPGIAVLAYGIIWATGEPLTIPAPVTLAIFPMFAFFFIGALGEEIGWSGYATEPLQHRCGTVTASILLGLVWAVFHFIPLMQAHRSAEWIAWWSLGTISLRMIMTWLYIHSGRSVFGAAIFHAMINLSWQLFPNNGSFYDPRVFGLITLCFAIVILTAEQLLTKSSMQAA